MAPSPGDCDTVYPEIEVSPPWFSFDVPSGSDDSDTLFITNTGDDTLHWSIADNCPWLGALPAAGAVAPGGVDEVMVTVSAAGIGAGVFGCDLEISSDDPYEPYLEVQVVMDVEAAIVINEIYVDPDSYYDGAEFIEIFNPTPYDVNIGGWVLCGTEYLQTCGGEDRWEFPTGATIPANGYIVVAKDGGDGEDGFYEAFGFHPDYEMWDWSFVHDVDDPLTPDLILLDDDPASDHSDEIQLVGGRGYGVMCQGYSHADVVYLYVSQHLSQLIDLVEYFDPEYCTGDPCPGDDVYDDNAYPGVPLEGESLGRSAASTDTDDSSVDWSRQEPTPGQVNIENRPPRVRLVGYGPIPPMPGAQTYVSAIVADEGTLTQVTVAGTADGGPIASDASADPGDSLYVAAFPALPEGTVLSLQVFAHDDGGAVTESDEFHYYIGVVDSIAHVQKASPFAGKSLVGLGPRNLRGIVTAGTETFSDDTFYIHDAALMYSGIRVYAPGLADAVEIGDDVTVCGNVDEFYGETELALHSPESMVVHSSGNPGYGPVDVTTEQISLWSYTAEAFEGQLVRVLDATVILEPGSYGQWWIVDSSSFEAQIDDHADYEYEPMLGDVIEEISGIVRYSYGEYELDPRGDEDIIGPPRITEVRYATIPPTGGTPLTISANLEDNIGIVSATAYVGTTPDDPDTSYAMSPDGRGIWSAEVGSFNDGDRVYYHVECSDGAAVARKPSTGQYSLFVGIEEIYDVQYSPYSGPSPMEGLAVNVQGYVTVEPGVLRDDLFYIADASGAWNGIGVFDRSGTASLERGDFVTCCGTVDEYYDETQIALHFPEAVVASTPRGEPVSATSIATSELMYYWEAEEWEGVYVHAEDCEVIDPHVGHGEWKISNGAPTDTCRVNDTADYAYVPALGDNVFVRGVVVYTYGTFKIEPRDDADIAVNPVGIPVGETPVALRLHQNVPNPFNPVTLIRYELPQEMEVALRVYDAAGRLVRELVPSEVQRAGPYAVSWSGRDGAGREVGTGVYFYQLEAGEQTLSRKMLLLK